MNSFSARPKSFLSNPLHSFGYFFSKFCTLRKEDMGTSYSTFWHMDSRMIGSSYYLQVFNTIVQPVPILMMYHFGFLEITTQMFFHYQAMFADITISITRRMIRARNKLITVLKIVPITSTGHHFGMMFIPALLRARLFMFIAVAAPNIIKFLTAPFTEASELLHNYRILIITPRVNT